VPPARSPTPPRPAVLRGGAGLTGLGGAGWYGNPHLWLKSPLPPLFPDKSRTK